MKVQSLPEARRRFAWAAAIIDPQPHEQLLEIGCGAGLLVEALGKKLNGGKIVAVDRSATMIRHAAKRNQVLIAAKKLELVPAAFAQTRFKKAAFHKIAAFNVNVFWQKGKPELELVRHYLKAGGYFYLFYQNPTDISQRFIDAVTTSLQDHGFRIVETVLQSMKPTRALGIISKPE